jgi:cytochrome c-type biogenesis protein CcmH/NrfF
MKTHKLDPVSLVFGAIFTLIGLAFVTFQNPWRALIIDIEWSWLGPVVLVALGLLVLAPVFRRRNEPVEHPGEPPEEAFEELAPNPLD